MKLYIGRVVGEKPQPPRGHMLRDPTSTNEMPQLVLRAKGSREDTKGDKVIDKKEERTM